MSLISHSEIQKIDSEISRASVLGDTPLWQKTHAKYTSQKVTVEMPLGELTNSRIQGFLWGAKMTGRLKYPLPIMKSDRFQAQGLEGKFRVHTNMLNAVLIYREVPKNRIQIKKDHVEGRYA